MAKSLVAAKSLGLPGTISRTAWQLPARLSFERWRQAGEILAHVEGAVSWWIGDWWIAGHAYGERLAVVDSLEWRGPEYQACKDCGMVARRFERSRRRDLLSFSHHREVAVIDDISKQNELLDWAIENRASTRELRLRVQQRWIEGRLGAMVFPQGRFPVLYIDPPWRYENPPLGGGNRAIERNYPTMTLEELCALPVSDIAADDAILYMWATAPKLAEALKLVDAWTFAYRTNNVWVKDRIGMGYHARSQHELLLIAKRGELPPPQAADRVSSVIYADRAAHSEKPVEFYELIERWYPTLPRIELFARGSRPGWSSWGNQLRQAAE